MRSFLIMLTLGLGVYGQATADWRDWWRTPEQQAKAAFDQDDTDTLMRVAPDTAWQGVAEHKSADYEAAAATFNEVVTQQELAGNTREATRALYNRAVSEVRAGQYEKAVETFDQVLERDQQFPDAEHNRDIAKQLIQQQQQPPSQSQEGGDEGDSDDNESQDQSEQQQSSSGEEQSESGSESGDEDQSESQDSQDSEQNESGGQQGDSSDASETETDEQQARDEQAARDALEAEAREGGEGDQETDSEQQEDAMQREAPLTESEQATEQWLRRIPDDPAGLLRRKLEQSHRTEYPEVRDAQESW